MSGKEIETLYNTKKCWYCHNNKPAIGNQRKNGKTFYNNKNGSNDWKNESCRKYCKKCNKNISESRGYCYMTNPYEEATEEEQIKNNLKRHESYLDYKRNQLQEKIDENNTKKLNKSKKSKKSKN